jgi:hypothetical protein
LAAQLETTEGFGFQLFISLSQDFPPRLWSLRRSPHSESVISPKQPPRLSAPQLATEGFAFDEQFVFIFGFIKTSYPINNTMNDLEQFFEELLE